MDGCLQLNLARLKAKGDAELGNNNKILITGVPNCYAMEQCTVKNAKHVKNEREKTVNCTHWRTIVCLNHTGVLS